MTGVSAKSLAALNALRCQIFGNVYNQSNTRTGAKYLKKALVGDSMLKYYPPQFKLSTIFAKATIATATAITIATPALAQHHGGHQGYRGHGYHGRHGGYHGWHCQYRHGYGYGYGRDRFYRGRWHRHGRYYDYRRRACGPVSYFGVFYPPGRCFWRY